MKERERVGSSRSEAVTSPDHQHWFEPIADHLGSAYLRYSFTKGTVQEIDFLVERLGLEPGTRVLDVGCGPGRHAHELARRGLRVHGIDIAQRFVDLAVEHAPADAAGRATFERLDARELAERTDWHGAYDVVICLCQGAFGLMTANGDDERVLTGMARCLRPGGQMALSAFNAYFAVKYFDGEGEGRSTFDADTGVNHERTEVRSETGESRAVDLWTGCYTPRELRLLCGAAGLDLRNVYSVEPGRYEVATPTVETAEFLVVASRA